MVTSINKDILIFGGGIAGLWLLNRLRNEGYDAILFEHKALGSGQVIASQGMIHGGIKYALSGKLNSSSNAIADMPAHWQACLQNHGDIELAGTNILSEQYYLWPKNSMRSRLNAFLGSKVVRGKVETVSPSNYPDFFHDHISGPLYQLNDIVLDTPSLLETLSSKYRQHIHQIDWTTSSLTKDINNGIHSLKVPTSDTDEQFIEVQAQRYIFTCGAGTEALLKRFDLAPSPVAKQQIGPFDMQLRPLQMTMVKHDLPHSIYVHCVADQLTSTPELTITSHRTHDEKWVWYLGGELAESGANRSPDEQIAAAQDKLESLFPWCDLRKQQWQTLFIDRAEAKQKNGKRPENASTTPYQNMIIGWPSKLTLAPNLANMVLDLLRQQDITPASKPADSGLVHLPFPGIATTPWSNM